MMAPYIFFCCIYFRNDYDEKLWSALKIQKIFRGHNVRWKNYKASTRYSVEMAASIKIQKTYRMYHTRMQYKPIYEKYHKFYVKTHAIMKLGRPRLRLGRIARVLQRSYRMYRFRLLRHQAAAKIQIPYRAFYIRTKWEELILKIRNKAAATIQRCAWIFICRCRRRDMKNRQHIAAYRIFVSYIGFRDFLTDLIRFSCKSS